MLLIDAKVDVDYQVQHIDLNEGSCRHLATMGLKQGTHLKLIAKTKSNAIVMVKGARLAFDNAILERVSVVLYEGEGQLISLADLPVGHLAYVKDINTVGEAKRRLMDMGLTKHTKICLRKVAPLGDPIEISLRGYELTLRKSEAQLITVVEEE